MGLQYINSTLNGTYFKNLLTDIVASHSEY